MQCSRCRRQISRRRFRASSPWRAVPEHTRTLNLTKARLMTDSRVPRRSFLTAAAATVAGAAIGVAGTPARAGASSPFEPFHASEPAPPHEIKLGVASYSLREFPLDKALEMIKTLRTPYVNFKSV